MQEEWKKAVRNGDASKIEKLVDEGAEINARDRYSQTALMLASQHGHADIVRLLVDRGADLNVKAKYNLTSLMLAIINNQDEIARILVDAGANLSLTGTGAPGFHGKTAYDLAMSQGNTVLAGLLQPRGKS